MPVLVSVWGAMSLWKREPLSALSERQRYLHTQRRGTRILKGLTSKKRFSSFVSSKNKQYSRASLICESIGGWFEIGSSANQVFRACEAGRNLQAAQRADLHARQGT